MAVSVLAESIDLSQRLQLDHRFVQLPLLLGVLRRYHLFAERAKVGLIAVLPACLKLVEQLVLQQLDRSLSWAHSFWFID